MQLTVLKLSVATVSPEIRRVNGRNKRKKVGVFLDNRFESISNSEHTYCSKICYINNAHKETIFFNRHSLRKSQAIPNIVLDHTLFQLYILTEIKKNNYFVDVKALQALL